MGAQVLASVISVSLLEKCSTVSVLPLLCVHHLTETCLWKVTDRLIQLSFFFFFFCRSGSSWDRQTDEITGITGWQQLGLLKTCLQLVRSERKHSRRMGQTLAGTEHRFSLTLYVVAVQSPRHLVIPELPAKASLKIALQAMKTYFSFTFQPLLPVRSVDSKTWRNPSEVFEREAMCWKQRWLASKT